VKNCSAWKIQLNGFEPSKVVSLYLGGHARVVFSVGNNGACRLCCEELFGEEIDEDEVGGVMAPCKDSCRLRFL